MNSGDPTPQSAAVTVDAVTKRFAGGTAAVDPLSLRIPVGQFVALVGPSGCGKSTLLRMIAGLETPTSGAITLAAATAAAFVFQDAHLLPWRTVIDNVALPLELAHVLRRERRERAAAALAQVGLDDVAARYPAQLSGGMRMRVSLARALVGRPNMLLLDEPFAALDEITRQQLDDLLRSLWQRGGMTVLFVTHSIQEAAYLADRTIVFSRGPARVTLDHATSLGDARYAKLRASPEFAAETGVLFEALQRGSA